MADSAEPIDPRRDAAAPVHLFGSDDNRDAAFGAARPDPVAVEEAWATWRREVANADRFVEGSADLERTGTMPDGGELSYVKSSCRSWRNTRATAATPTCSGSASTGGSACSRPGGASVGLPGDRSGGSCGCLRVTGVAALDVDGPWLRNSRGRAFPDCPWTCPPSCRSAPCEADGPITMPTSACRAVYARPAGFVYESLSANDFATAGRHPNYVVRARSSRQVPALIHR